MGVPKAQNGRGGQSSPGKRSSGTRSLSGFKLILLLAVLLLGGQPSQSGGEDNGLNAGTLLGSLGGGSVSSGWQGQANTGKLDTSVDPSAQAKRVQLLGNGRDTVTIMVYIKCW